MFSHKAMYKLGAKPLGVGGQAEVFEATHRITGQIVALKRVKSISDVTRMKREIEVQTTISNSHIMPVLDYDTSYTWYTMPLALKTLYSVLPPLHKKEISIVVEQCAIGLSIAHDNNYIHRDLTPKNILLIDEVTPQWVVSDWGLVRRHGMTSVVHTEKGHLGTEGFSAPEMWRDPHNADQRADIYSLGKVIEWMVTGEWPTPNMPNSKVDGIFKDFIQKCTFLKPDDRFTNMDEVIASIKNIEGFSIHELNPKVERFVPYMRNIILYIWNNGENREVSREQIRNDVGVGAYGNHKKLRLNPWNLLEESPYDKNIRLTERGILFAKGELKIPQKIVQKRPDTDWITDEKSRDVSIHDI